MEGIGACTASDSGHYNLIIQYCMNYYRPHGVHIHMPDLWYDLWYDLWNDLWYT